MVKLVIFQDLMFVKKYQKKKEKKRNLQLKHYMILMVNVILNLVLEKVIFFFKLMVLLDLDGQEENVKVN